MKAGFYVFGRNTPTFLHPSQQSAEMEAARLATANPGDVFQVLAIISQCKKESVTWERVDDLPF